MAVAGYFVWGTRLTKLGLFPNGGTEIQKNGQFFFIKIRVKIGIF